MRDGVEETLPLMWVSCGAFDELRWHGSVSAVFSVSLKEINTGSLIKLKKAKLYGTQLDPCLSVCTAF